jgi:hypothetical protein
MQQIAHRSRVSGPTMIKAVASLAMFLTASNADAACVLGQARLLVREFSLPRNSVCIIKRTDAPSKFVAIRTTLPPKLGQFGKASIMEMAYRAGNVAGDDYFEYVSTEIENGVKRDLRIRNTVHITP